MVFISGDTIKQGGVGNKPVSQFNLDPVEYVQPKFERYNNLTKRKHACPICRDFYNGEQTAYLKQDWDLAGINNDKFTLFPINITKQVIESKACVYKQKIKRKITDDKGNELEKDQELWDQKVAPLLEYDEKMRDLEEQMGLQGTIIAVVTPAIEEAKEEEIGKKILTDKGEVRSFTYDKPVQLVLCPPDACDVILNKAGKISELVYSHGDGEFYGFETSPTISPSELQSNNLQTDQQGLHRDKKVPSSITYWSQSSITIIKQTDKAPEVDDSENPYGIIPAVPCHSQEPTSGCFWQPCDEALVYENHSLNMIMTGADYGMKGAFSVPVFENWNTIQEDHVEFNNGVEEYYNSSLATPSDDWLYKEKYTLRGLDRGKVRNKITIGPDKALLPPMGGKFDYVSPQMFGPEIYNVVNNKLALIAVSHGLPASTFRFQVDQDSGAKVVVDHNPLVQYRKRMERIFEKFEKALFQVIKVIWNESTSQEKFSDICELDVEFPEYEMPLRPDQKIDLRKKEIELGVTKPTDVIKELHPDVQDIDNYLIEVREERKQMMLMDPSSESPASLEEDPEDVSNGEYNKPLNSNQKE